MRNRTASALRAVQMPATDVSFTLEAARSQVEKRFLEGGAALFSIQEALNKLLASLEHATKARESESGSNAAEDLLQTVNTLQKLPDMEMTRQQHFAVLSDTGEKLRTHVSDMQETMRYLRTFAITVKITGAGVPEFAGFAQEILERIHSGTDEVNSFGNQLNALEKDLRLAMASGTATSKAYDATAPRVIDALERDAKTINAHRKDLATIASQVGAIAKSIQDKVTTTLSALHIGDLTRQRIEHVQASFALLQKLLDGDDGRKLSADARQRLENVVHHLTAAQMRAAAEDFGRSAHDIVKTIASFSEDTQEILRLQDEMPRTGAVSKLTQTLRESMSIALGIVKQVEMGHVRADGINRSTLDTASSLLKSVETIRVVKTDIHYMALNTNLRCSKMGEAGRSINVVTAELRIFAAKLDDSADAIVIGLKALEETAGNAASSKDENAHRLHERLNAAADNIRTDADVMDGELKVLSEHGREAATKMSLSLGQLDFQHGLGETLTECADALSDMAGPYPADVSDLGDIFGPLEARIFSLYTASREREVHRNILPAPIAASPAALKPAKKTRAAPALRRA